MAASALIFAVEPLAKCWHEWLELAALQWAETERYRHSWQRMNPSFERYNVYDAAGWFLMFTARDPARDNLLAGSCGVYLVPSMHTQDMLATEDTWYLRPEYRKGRTAIDFYKFGEAELIRRGATEFSVSSKIIDGKPTTGRLLEYLDFEMVAVGYSKRLQENLALKPARADSPRPQPQAVKESPDVRTVTTCST